eukprot:CAMPEP_0113888444 /NCGR_PEP_ID=MMETSP0780_2-20120614/12866_1 /TAXON_ID=652834 /ORGANISM="Palpitomonas bilix" /LENGTH=530 /DNA_ID=CAMNT_0000877275 /DNA_START=56 /DNA_END=1648 /DNA_ORIENTATION=+ /assembly_acc=CAM_ASM_000599
MGGEKQVGRVAYKSEGVNEEDFASGLHMSVGVVHLPHLLHNKGVLEETSTAAMAKSLLAFRDDGREGEADSNEEVRNKVAASLKAELLAVVKADAYGHGAVRVSSFLSTSGVTDFAVAQVKEGIELRREKAVRVTDSILVFAPPVPSSLPLYHTYSLSAAVSSLFHAKAIVEAAERDHLLLRCHVCFDGGMGRVGARSISEIVAIVQELKSSENERKKRGGQDGEGWGVVMEGVFSHYPSADDPSCPQTHEQWRRNRRVLEEIEKVYSFPLLHFSNSAGSLLLSPLPFPTSTSFLSSFLPSAGTQQRRVLIRSGISLYGTLGSEEVAVNFPLLPCMQLFSTVTFVKVVNKGTKVSYGGTWVAKRRTGIATIAIGYADGYRRMLSYSSPSADSGGEDEGDNDDERRQRWKRGGRAYVGINGHSYAVVGRVCMDAIMVEIPLPADSSVSGGAEGSAADGAVEAERWEEDAAGEGVYTCGEIGGVKVGDRVALFSHDPADACPTLFDFAQLCQTITYEVTCALTNRVERVYRG